LPQKSDVGGFSVLHLAQCFASAFPHFAQKLFVEGLFVPHFEQRIDAPREPGNRPLLHHPTSATDQQATEGRHLERLLFARFGISAPRIDAAGAKRGGQDYRHSPVSIPFEDSIGTSSEEVLLRQAFSSNTG
jgi:hypothetical protein